MATNENAWRKRSFRECVTRKIGEALLISGMSTTKNSIDMENQAFQNAKTKEEYLGFVGKLLLHIRDLNSAKGAGGATPGTPGSGNQGMPDLIGALQTLALQETGNNQIMGMNGPGPNPTTAYKYGYKS